MYHLGLLYYFLITPPTSISYFLTYACLIVMQSPNWISSMDTFLWPTFALVHVSEMCWLLELYLCDQQLLLFLYFFSIRSVGHCGFAYCLVHIVALYCSFSRHQFVLLPPSLGYITRLSNIESGLPDASIVWAGYHLLFWSWWKLHLLLIYPKRNLWSHPQFCYDWHCWHFHSLPLQPSVWALLCPGRPH